MRGASLKIIYDTDIGWMNDDCIALLFALHCPEIEVLGVTPVMGNYDLAYEVACALRLTEVAGHAHIPVAAGFDRPLLHERGSYADQMWGKWATFEKGFTLPPGHPRLKADPRHAVDFIIDTLRANPGEVTLVAVGPLTNVAIALRKAPDIAALAKRVVVMGGGINLFPGGWGNSTPLAEFNFWVDPEAARIVMRGNSIGAVINAAIVGIGIALVPCYLVAGEPTIRRLVPGLLLEREVWLVFHPDAGRIARVRRVIDFVTEVLEAERRVLRGAAN